MHVKHENEMKASKYVSKFSRRKLVLALLDSWELYAPLFSLEQLVS